MRSWQFVIALAVVSPSVCFPADTLFPWPSVPDISDGDGLYIGAGVGVEYEGEYDGSDDYSAEPEPVFSAQWRRGTHTWFLEGQEAGLRTRLGDRWLLLGGLRFEGGRDANEAPELAGLNDVDDEVVAIAEVRRALGQTGNTWLAGRVQAGDSDIGLIGIAAAGHTFPARESGMGLDVFAFTTVATSEFVNRDFGISSAESTASGLTSTDLSGGYRSVGLQAIGRWRIHDKIQLQIEAGVEQYSSEINDSPIALDDYEAEVGVSVIYRFKPQ